jgi:hypothetical protein
MLSLLLPSIIWREQRRAILMMKLIHRSAHIAVQPGSIGAKGNQMASGTLLTRAS